MGNERWNRNTSTAQDRVWAQVAGISPRKAGSRLFVVLQAFTDESYDQGGIFALGGYIASAEAWAEFAKEWEDLLPRFGVLDKDGEYHFKMREMATTAERLERVPAFYRVIEKYAITAFSCSLYMSELQSARERIYVPGLKINYAGFWGSPYKIAFKALLDTFHGYREEFPQIIPLDEKVDFYFDNHSEKGGIRAAWDEYMANGPPIVRQRYGVEPSVAIPTLVSHG